MHHLYPLAKGDPLCPLGFHPQVRWPTRCKRCFRDYKEHCGKKKADDPSLKRDISTASSPNLNSWTSPRSESYNKSWTSSSNLSQETESRSSTQNSDYGPASWCSTPDLNKLEDNTQANIPTVSLTLPKRKSLQIERNHHTVSDSFTTNTREKSPVYNKSDSLSTRAKKLQIVKEGTKEKPKRIQIKELNASVDENTNHDVQFLIQVKSKSKPQKTSSEGTESEDDTISIAGTETTDTTLVGDTTEFQEQLDSMKEELDTMKTKCDRLEREKSDLILRRLASMETIGSKTSASEVLKLQQKCNELQSQMEDFRDDKKSLSLKVKELEADLENRPTAQQAQKIADELRSKLLAAETLCEELMDENEDMKKELRDLEEEMEELQDNFREDQANEYTSLKKELEQTTKNCRILSFKLRKTERKTEQLETEKGETEKKLKEVAGGLNNSEKIKQLEQDLKVANESALRLQKELEEAKGKIEATDKKKAPMLGSITKVPSTEGKVSRESLTRGGSQDDPAQILRDLHDCLEREADLREQLKFAEEEAQNLRKKVSRIEDDNESLVLQLKKMAMKAKNRKSSPNRLAAEPINDKEEGLNEDPAELKLLLELNEQEASVLRKKVEELETEKLTQKRKIKDLQDKLTTRTTKKSLIGSKLNDPQEQRIKILEDEISDLKTKLVEKEREIEMNELKKHPKGITKSKSLDLADQQAFDLKRQLQLVEQEATVLRNKVQSLETESEKMSLENKRFQLLQGTKNMKSDRSSEKYIDKIAELEVELEYAKKKIKDFEDKTEKSLTDTKLRPAEKADVEKIKVQLSKVENERDKLQDTLKKLKETAAKSFKDRTPKKPSEFTSKIQLKKMVNELESEIGEILVALHNTESTKAQLESELKQSKSQTLNNNQLEETFKELEKMKTKVVTAENELRTEKSKNAQEKTKFEDINNSLLKTTDNLNTQKEEIKSLRAELNDIKQDKQTLVEAKRKLENEVESLRNETKNVTTIQDELSSYKQQIQTLKSEMSKKEKNYNNLKKNLEEKEKTIKDFKIKDKRLEELERLLEENQDKLRRTELEHKEKVIQLTVKLEEHEETIKTKDHDHINLSTRWTEDCKSYDVQIQQLNNKINSLEDIITTKNNLVQQLEESVKKERESASLLSTSTNTKAINKLTDELNKSKANVAELEVKLEMIGKMKKSADDKLKKIEGDGKKEKVILEKKLTDLDIDLQNEKRKADLLKLNYETDQKNKEKEIETLKNKIKALETNSSAANKTPTKIRQEYQEKIEKLESSIAAKQQQYSDLTAKYEILEEEHVVTKAKLVMEKEAALSQLSTIKQDLEDTETHMVELKDEYDANAQTSAAENSQLHEKLKVLQKTAQASNTSQIERERFKSVVEEKVLELDQLRKEYDVINDQLEYTRRENDEVKKKLDDYDRVSKIQRNMSADSTAMEKEIKLLRTRLASADKIRKSDVAELKMRYDSQVTVINNEIRSLQNQVTRFKRERDTYKHMLESAQKTIGDLKQNPTAFRENRNSIASIDEVEESRTKIVTLEQQVSCMEDELSEARLEASKLKTELVSERSSWEIKLSELHSRVNELEEEKILNSGRTKISGLKTRMELAWHKEREEQQRLLQETSTLARDLRQTLFEVERERDKERLEAKRKQEQLKKALEEDQDENKRKLTELQCDLLELRDAHAKLRTTNEKLRREKERHEKDREDFRAVISERKRLEHEDERKMNALIKQVELLLKLTPEIAGSREGLSNELYTPTPPRRRRGSKSRETTPDLERRDTSRAPSTSREESTVQLQSVLSRLNDVTQELQRYKVHTEENRERERLRRTMGLRRATSTEHDNISNSNQPSVEYVKNGSTATSLHRRSLSLEHTIQQEQSIWRMDDDSMSSLQSIDGVSDIDTRWTKRDISLDSRLSAGSTQSDSGGTEKKKKSLMGKLKKLTKSRSIDDQDPGQFSPVKVLSSKQSSSSDVDEHKGSKRDLKDRITGIFKKTGSSSRSNSTERQRTEKLDNPSSTQRPLKPSGSNSSISRTSPDPEKISKLTSRSSKYK